MRIVFPLGSYHTDQGLSRCGLYRVQAAARLLTAQPDSVAVISGGALNYGPDDSHYPYVHSALLEYGVGSERITLVLEHATNTVEEAFMLSSALEGKEIESITLVTSQIHYPRAPFIFAHFFPLPTLNFCLTPNGLEPAALLYAQRKEHEFYHQLRSQNGIYFGGDKFMETEFQDDQFEDLIRDRIMIED